ncbi:MAG: glycosyltransferase [Aliarcobacter sp.]
MESHPAACLDASPSAGEISARNGVRKSGVLQGPAMRIVAFHSNTMSLRGSENALWDYANFNETILGNHSLICHPAELEKAENPTFAKWKARFSLVPYRTKAELSTKLKERRVDILYQIKPGPYDGFVIRGVKNCIHSMFLSDEFHGDAFAYVSRWCSKVMTGREESFVPHFVPQLESKVGLRGKLGISTNARVFGRHGGWDTFNIPFVREAVVRHARQNPEDHFVFLNTESIHEAGHLANIHYLPATVDPVEKAKFLATCDAMLHARWHGETFGLAVGEFAVLGKPVITFSESRERAHLEMLGRQALLYGSAGELLKIIKEFRPHTTLGTEYEIFADPKVVMEIFRKKFLEN